MLKFLRKYQLILLAVGGSLLMVVFLLQPVLQQLTPDPRKQTVAKIGEIKITMGDQIAANQELELLARFLPQLMPLVGLEDEETRTAHWMLLKHEAERLGVMGLQRDGSDWIEELAFSLAQSDLQRFRESGQQIPPEFAQQYAEQAFTELLTRRQALVRGNRGLSEAAFDSVLSTARGVMRMRRLYDGAPQLTKARTAASFIESETAVLTDQIVLGPDLLIDQVDEPSDADVTAFFAEYRNTVPGNTDLENGGNEFGFGYLLPARLKLEWLALDRGLVGEVVKADPVAVRRRWQRENPDGGDFAADRAAIEETVRSEMIERVMTDADEIIRGEILNQTRSLEKEGIYRVVPSEWAAPDLERIALKVVDSIQERHGVRLSLPSVSRRTDAWQSPAELQSLPGIGQAYFQVGNQISPVFQLPDMVRGIGTDTRVPVQSRVPVIDPPAVGRDGSKYYITVLEARGESPPDSVDEIRFRVVENIKNKRAFEMHAAQLAAYREAASAGGLDAVAALFPGSLTVRVNENIFVTRDRLAPAEAISRPDPRANRPAFREAVLAAAADVDPLAEPDSITGADAIVAAALPGSRSVAIARVRAKRPPAVEYFRRFQANVVVGEVRRMVQDAEGDRNPLAFAVLSERLGYEAVGAAALDEAEG